MKCEVLCLNSTLLDLLLLYFSGHGIKDDDGNLYFATADTECNLLHSTSVPASFINELMKHSGSRRQILLLDCCYSGAFAKGLVAKNDERMGIKERFEGRGRVILTASNSVQYSFESKKLSRGGSYSIFTRHLVNGLRTGEADQDRDGYISLDELYDYAYNSVIEENPHQHPQKWAFDVQGEIVIARNLNAALLRDKQTQVRDTSTDITIDLVLSSRQLHIGTQKWFDLENRQIKIDIPSKINKNRLFCIPGRGKLNPNTKLRGNLYLRIVEDSSPDQLGSAKGLNYVRLRDLLALGKWKEADKETYELILTASKRNGSSGSRVKIV